MPDWTSDTGLSIQKRELTTSELTLLIRSNEDQLAILSGVNAMIINSANLPVLSARFVKHHLKFHTRECGDINIRLTSALVNSNEGINSLFTPKLACSNIKPLIRLFGYYINLDDYLELEVDYKPKYKIDIKLNKHGINTRILNRKMFDMLEAVKTSISTGIVDPIRETFSLYIG